MSARRHVISHAIALAFGDAKTRTGRGIDFKPVIPYSITPAAASANAICLSQSVSSGVAALLNGATAGILDVPRAVVAAWTGTAIMTLTARDTYGNLFVEQSASGTTFAGKKAAKEIVSVTFNAAVTLATVGTSDIFGLPWRIRGKRDIVAAYANDTADIASATVVAGDTTNPATATTGDPRGTFDPNTAANGTTEFIIYMVTVDGSETGAKGIPHYAG